VPGSVLPGQRLTAALLGMPAWTPMTLINSWTNFSGSAAGQYRYWELTNELEVIGCIQHASISGTSQFCQTFTSNLPNSRQRDIAAEIILTGTPTLQVSYGTNGILEFAALHTGSTVVEFHCWLSLDA
jgi:hypothetical protein